MSSSLTNASPPPSLLLFQPPLHILAAQWLPSGSMPISALLLLPPPWLTRPVPTSPRRCTGPPLPYYSMTKDRLPLNSLSVTLSLLMLWRPIWSAQGVSWAKGMGKFVLHWTCLLRLRHQCWLVWGVRATVVVVVVVVLIIISISPQNVVEAAMGGVTCDSSSSSSSSGSSSRQ